MGLKFTPRDQESPAPLAETARHPGNCSFVRKILEGIFGCERTPSPMPGLALEEVDDTK